MNLTKYFFIVAVGLIVGVSSAHAQSVNERIYQLKQYITKLDYHIEQLKRDRQDMYDTREALNNTIRINKEMRLRIPPSNWEDLKRYDDRIAEDENNLANVQRHIERISAQIMQTYDTISQTNNEIMDNYRRNTLPEDCSSGVDDGTPNWNGFMNCPP